VTLEIVAEIQFLIGRCHMRSYSPGAPFASHLEVAGEEVAGGTLSQ